MAVLPGHMQSLKELLVRNGFIKSSNRGLYTLNDKQEWVLKEGGGINADHADVEVNEEENVAHGHSYLPTGYPTPSRRYRIIIESMGASIEEPYYWFLEHTKQDQGYPFMEKITDTFTSSEQSAFWGAAQSRMGLQQDRASQNMRSISEMVKQLFQLVRELRILDEKMAPRKEWETSSAADMTLKAEYTDIVENRAGQVQPGSIYHLAQTVGYTILPDLFFNTHVYRTEDVDAKIDGMKYNTNVKNVLKRKLYAFLNWKLKTDAELRNRRNFTLKYLRQHWNTIKMLMNWVKPYLRNIARMQMNPEVSESPDIVGAFETSVIELEVLAYKQPVKGAHSCVLLSFKFRTRPELSFQQDSYQHRGPIHVGKVEACLRAYAWTKDEIEAYKKYRRQEDMNLLGMVDANVKDAMDALGEDLENYLSEAGEKEFTEKKKAAEAAAAKAKKQVAAGSMNILDPFVSVFKGIWELGSALGGSGLTSIFSSSKGGGGRVSSKALEDAQNISIFNLYQIYKNYKKAHGFLSW